MWMQIEIYFTYCRQNHHRGWKEPIGLLSPCRRWPWRTEEEFQWKYFHSMPTAVEDQTLFTTWPTWTWSLLFLVLVVSFSGSRSHLGVFGNGHATRSVMFIKPGHWVVCVTLLVLLPQTLLLQDLPRCLPPRQRHPNISQNEHLLIICWPLQVNHHSWLT